MNVRVELRKKSWSMTEPFAPRSAYNPSVSDPPLPGSATQARRLDWGVSVPFKTSSSVKRRLLAAAP